MKNLMLPKLITMFILVGLVSFHPMIVNSSSLQAMNVRLNLDSLTCNKTTEAGEDEVYFLVRTDYGKGQGKWVRYPCGNAHQENCHWNMNDGKEPRRIGPYQLDINLNKGQSAVMLVHIMEEDGGLPGDWAQKAGEALQMIDDPKAQAVGVIAQVLGRIASIFELGKDTDDFIGSFAVRVTNDNGSLKYDWIKGERIEKQDGGTMRLETASKGVTVQNVGLLAVSKFKQD